MANNSVLARLAVKISADSAEFGKQLKSAQSSVKDFTAGLTRIAGAVGIAFGVNEVAQFALEVSKLAGEAEGVRAAFDRLPDSKRLMDDLKEATAGTVSELDLMKRTVQASNFGIALESLPDLLKFASIRAQQTGQSVDYLVDSIITGIGRKSPLILDNLGISAVRLKEQFNGAALEAQSIGDVAKAVGRIASEELGKMGEFSENASTELQRLSANFENLKVALGGAGNQTGLFSDAIEVANQTVVNLTNFLKGEGSTVLKNWLKIATLLPRTTLKAANVLLDAAGGLSLDQEISAANKLLSGLKFPEQELAGFNDFLNQLALKANEAGKKILVLSDGFGKTQLILQELPKSVDATTQSIAANDEGTKSHLNTLSDLKAKLDELNKQFDSQTDINDKRKLANIGREIVSTEKLIAEINKLRQARAAATPPPNESVILSGVSNPGNKTGAGFLADLGITPESLNETLIAGLDRLQVKTSQTLGNMKEEWADFSGAIGGAISDVAFSFGQAVAGVGNFGDSILRALIGFAKQVGEILIATGVGMLAAKKLIDKPGAAIAAGAAILAIAGAASAALQKSQANYNSGGNGASDSFNRGSISSGMTQDSKVQVEVSGVLRGEDIWLSGNNFEAANKYIKTTGRG